MWAEFRHDEVGRAVEYDIADVEESETGRDLLRRQVEHIRKVVTLGRVHSLC